MNKTNDVNKSQKLSAGLGMKMRKHGIAPNKRLGQNFLIDPSMIFQCVTAIDPKKSDYVIEVGPGLGSLTDLLQQKCGFLCAVEIDKKMAQVLSVRYQDRSNVLIRHADILKTDPHQLLLHRDKGESTRTLVVGNLPYYITTPILMHFLHADFPCDTYSFMMQQEVADRMEAKPNNKTYGAISVLVQLTMRIKHCFVVPPHCFYPQPNVQSVFVQLEKRENVTMPKDRGFFTNIVKAAFNQRRKTLANALINRAKLPLARKTVLDVIKSLEIRENARAEQLTVDQFRLLSDALAAQVQKITTC